MTVREYISEKLRAFNIGGSQLTDMALSGIELDDDYSASNAEAVGRAFVPVLAELMLSPYQKSINENGFSVSWDMEGLGRWYLWLCKKYGLEPDYTVVPGISSVIEISDIW